MKDEKGFSLIEVLVSLALLGSIGVVFLSSLGTASRVTISADTRETARNLAETQMEYIKDQAYAVTYTPAPIPEGYAGYVAVINAESLQDTSIQRVTVTIERHGTAVTSLESYKMR